MPLHVRRRWPQGLLFTLAILAGCAPASAPEAGLQSAIKAHYAAHATEEDGACRSPRIDTIQAHRLIEKTAEGEDVLMVRYSYYDRHADMDQAWDKLVHLSQPCGGIAERRFVLASDGRAYHVTGMSGETTGEPPAR